MLTNSIDYTIILIWFGQHIIFTECKPIEDIDFKTNSGFAYFTDTH